ncbi:hypothetical protein BDV98DRAFT_577352 [Pterulicium gracile]|uniref:Thaumatin n=1 Tax=Pterulicium gracile TaxID=1884261 RepID=A0A5C3Q1G8_9AGAR|nr:hypothetical protein BDV98DRAFT_577352 [Pterula gracilis]
MLFSSPRTSLVLGAIAALPFVSAGTLLSPPLLRRQSPHPEHDNQPGIQWWATVEFKNNCPAGTTLAVYSPFEYKFTLNSVHSNARQSKTSMPLYAEDYNDITVFAMINEGNNPSAQEPNEKRYVYTSLFMDNYWLVKYPNSKVKDIPVSITPDNPVANGKCAKLVCNTQSCKANTEHPPGRKRSISEDGDKAAAALDWEGYVNHCPDTWKYTVTYCPDGKL